MPHKDYIVDGVKYPSVTEILGFEKKPWLDKWRDKWGVLADRKTACANAVGIAFHATAEALALGRDVEYPKNRRLGKMLEQVELWLAESGFVPLETELHVVSEKYKYSGTFDAVGFLRSDLNALVIVDWKTSSRIYTDMMLQLSAYAQAYEEKTGLSIKTGIIVHISKDKPDHKLTVKEYKLDEHIFSQFLRRLKKFREGNN